MGKNKNVWSKNRHHDWIVSILFLSQKRTLDFLSRTIFYSNKEYITRGKNVY